MSTSGDVGLEINRIDAKREIAQEILRDPVEDVSMKALGFGMARDRFAGDDVMRVHARIGEAVERARELSEPTLIEVLTYRFRGHSMSDAMKYRSKEELERARLRDPLVLYESRLIQHGLIGEDEIEKLEGEVRQIVDEAVKFADESPNPRLAALEKRRRRAKLFNPGVVAGEVIVEGQLGPAGVEEDDIANASAMSPAAEYDDGFHKGC